MSILSDNLYYYGISNFTVFGWMDSLVWFLSLRLSFLHFHFLLNYLAPFCDLEDFLLSCAYLEFSFLHVNEKKVVFYSFLKRHIMKVSSYGSTRQLYTQKNWYTRETNLISRLDNNLNSKFYSLWMRRPRWFSFIHFALRNFIKEIFV